MLGGGDGLGLGLGVGLNRLQAGAHSVTSYLFLDGGCLRARVADISHRYCDDEPLEVNWKLVGDGYTKVFYYDALPCRLPDQAEDAFQAEHKRVEDFHARLANLDRFRSIKVTRATAKGAGGSKRRST